MGADAKQNFWAADLLEMHVLCRFPSLQDLVTSIQEPATCINMNGI